MTLQELVEQGHRRVRKPQWAFPEDYVHLDVLLSFDMEPVPGPWAKLYSPLQHQIAEMDRPQVLMILGDTSTDWEPYMGPPASDERPAVDELGGHPEWMDS